MPKRNQRGARPRGGSHQHSRDVFAYLGKPSSGKRAGYRESREKRADLPAEYWDDVEFLKMAEVALKKHYPQTNDSRKEILDTIMRVVRNPNARTGDLVAAASVFVRMDALDRKDDNDQEALQIEKNRLQVAAIKDLYGTEEGARLIGEMAKLVSQKQKEVEDLPSSNGRTDANGNRNER